jgi:hypothetical protein
VPFIKTVRRACATVAAVLVASCALTVTQQTMDIRSAHASNTLYILRSSDRLNFCVQPDTRDWSEVPRGVLQYPCQPIFLQAWNLGWAGTHYVWGATSG